GRRPALGHRNRLGLPVRDDLPEGGLQRPDGRARRADGGDLRAVAGAVRGAARAGPLAVGGVQRDGGGGDAEPVPADRRERHGLDVRQLLDDGAAGGAGLVQEVPRRGPAGLRGIVPGGGGPGGGGGGGDGAGAGGEQRARLPPAVGEGIEGDCRQRNVAGRRGGALAAAGAGGQVEGVS